MDGWIKFSDDANDEMQPVPELLLGERCVTLLFQFNTLKKANYLGSDLKG